MSPEILALVSQFPLLGIFLWFVLHRDKETVKAQQTQNEEWREEFKKLSESWQTNVESRHVRYLTTFQKMTETLEALTRQLSKNTAVTILHDATVRGTNPETIGSTHDIIQKLMAKTDKFHYKDGS